jgi:hypothetical protein
MSDDKEYYEKKSGPTKPNPILKRGTISPIVKNSRPGFVPTGGSHVYQVCVNCKSAGKLTGMPCAYCGHPYTPEQLAERARKLQDELELKSSKKCTCCPIHGCNKEK